jgi:hypothetical protein
MLWQKRLRGTLFVVSARDAEDRPFLPRINKTTR